jgi:hypothetical protein
MWQLQNNWQEIGSECGDLITFGVNSQLMLLNQSFRLFFKFYNFRCVRNVLDLFKTTTPLSYNTCFLSLLLALFMTTPWKNGDIFIIRSVHLIWFVLVYNATFNNISAIFNYWFWTITTFSLCKITWFQNWLKSKLEKPNWSNLF